MTRKVLIPKHGYEKINASHSLGGPELTIKTVEEFTGVPINHYMEVNFQGFQGAVDALGGVWVNVPHAINDKKAASQSVHQRAAKIPAGYQLLDGEHALTFVRVARLRRCRHLSDEGPADLLQGRRRPDGEVD